MGDLSSVEVLSSHGEDIDPKVSLRKKLSLTMGALLAFATGPSSPNVYQPINPDVRPAVHLTTEQQKEWGAGFQHMKDILKGSPLGKARVHEEDGTSDATVIDVLSNTNPLDPTRYVQWSENDGGQGYAVNLDKDPFPPTETPDLMISETDDKTEAIFCLTEDGSIGNPPSEKLSAQQVKTAAENLVGVPNLPVVDESDNGFNRYRFTLKDGSSLTIDSSGFAQLSSDHRLGSEGNGKGSIGIKAPSTSAPYMVADFKSLIEPKKTDKRDQT